MNTVRSNVIDVALSPYTLASREFKRRVIGNERGFRYWHVKR